MERLRLRKNLFAFIMLLYLAACSFIFSGGDLSYPYYLDDYSVVVENPAVYDYAGATTYLSSPTSYIASADIPFQRELVTWSYALNTLILGTDPFWFRVVNLSFHFATTIVLYFLLLAAAPSLSPLLSLALSGFFFFSPPGISVATNIASRSEIFVTFFGMLSLLSFSRLKSKFGYFIGISALFLASYSKISYLIYIPIILTILRNSPRWMVFPVLTIAVLRNNLIHYSGLIAENTLLHLLILLPTYFLAALAWPMKMGKKIVWTLPIGFFIMAILGYFLAPEPGQAIRNYTSHLTGGLYSILISIPKLFLPMRMSIIHEPAPNNHLLLVLLGAIILISLVAWAVKLIRDNQASSVWIGLGLSAVFTYSISIPLILHFSENRLYAQLIFVILGLVAMEKKGGLFSHPKHAKYIAAALILFTLINTFFMKSEMSSLSDPLNYYQTRAAWYPTGPVININLANEKLKAGADPIQIFEDLEKLSKNLTEKYSPGRYVDKYLTDIYGLELNALIRTNDTEKFMIPFRRLIRNTYWSARTFEARILHLDYNNRYDELNRLVYNMLRQTGIYLIRGGRIHLEAALRANDTRTADLDCSTLMPRYNVKDGRLFELCGAFYLDQGDMNRGRTFLEDAKILYEKEKNSAGRDAVIKILDHLNRQ